MLCVYVENTVVATWMKIRLFARVCVCLHVDKVNQINGSKVDRSKEDKNLTLLTYMGMCVYIYKWWTVSMDLCFLKSACAFSCDLGDNVSH